MKVPMTVQTTAWRGADLGEPAKVMHLVDVREPEAGAGQLVVRMLASPANFPEALMCRGLYQVRSELPFIPGVELSGEVVAVGDGVEAFAVGDRVLGGAALPYGGFDTAVREAR